MPGSLWYDLEHDLGSVIAKPKPRGLPARVGLGRAATDRASYARANALEHQKLYVYVIVPEHTPVLLHVPLPEIESLRGLELTRS